MFVKTGDIVEQASLLTNNALTLFGQGKVEYNAQLCLMNLVVYGLTDVIHSGARATSSITTPTGSGRYLQKCPFREGCFDTTSACRGILASSCYPTFYRGHLKDNSPEYQHIMRMQKIWAEGSFAAMKRKHNLSQYIKWAFSQPQKNPLICHGIKPKKDG